MPSVTDLLARPHARSAATWARQRRREEMLARFPGLAQMRVLDLGGEPHTWVGQEPTPREVTLLNVEWKVQLQSEALAGTPEADWIVPVAGDACAPPATLREDRFDLVYSNSVIEHVGGHQRRKAFAYFAQTLGDHHWIQTPNRWFPVEPHWLCPGMQYLPTRARAAVSRTWPIGAFTDRGTPLAQRMDDVLDIELLGRSELSFYFPHSEIVRERVCGLTKSLIAVR